MLSKLRAKYGTHLCTMALSDFSMPEDDTQGAKFTVLPVELPSTGASDLRWVLQSPPSTGPSSSTNSVERYELYSFPTVDALAAASEEDLRALGMGYRAKFIVGTAQMVQAKCRAIALSEGRIGADTVDTAARCLDGRLWFDELRAVAAQAAAGEATDYGPSSPFPVIKTTAGTVALKHAIKKEALTEVKIESSASLETARQSMDAVVTVGRLRVQQQLMELPGVGRKVADCVALFSLDQTSAVPVDTHVWNIAIRDYAPSLRRSAPGAAAVAGREDGAEGAEGLVKAEPSSSPASAKSPTKNKRKASASIQVLESAADVDSLMPQFASPSAHSVTSAPASASVSAPAVSAPAVSASPFIETKSLTPGVYEQVGQVFRDRFGQHAGWAHSVLFAAELPAFRSKLPADLQREMLDFTLLQRSAKKAQRDEKASKNGGSKFNSPSALPMELEGQSDEERKRSSTPPKKSRK